MSSLRLVVYLCWTLVAGFSWTATAKRTVPIMSLNAHGPAPAGLEAPSLHHAPKQQLSASAPAPSVNGMVLALQDNYVIGPDGKRYMLPLPQMGQPTKKVEEIVDQPYLGGGSHLSTAKDTVALASIEGSLGGEQAMPSGAATAQQTAGNKLIATVLGGRLPSATGVSTSAVPFMPHGKGDGADLADGPENHASSGPIRYHWGGSVLPNPKIYLIFYGSWLCNNYANEKCASDYGAPSVIRDAVIGLSGSSWMNILTSYSDGAGTKLPNTLQYGDDTFVSKGEDCWKGTTLSDADVFSIVQCVLDKKKLPFTENSFYLVLSSGEVKETSGFCSSYCGWHAHDDWGPPLLAKNVRYGFVGSPNLCPKGCMKQRETSPNSIPEERWGISKHGSLPKHAEGEQADGMISIIAHEIAEAITDPDANAWFDDTGAENADKCSWKYGDTQITGNAKYNIELPCDHDKCSEWGKKNKRKFLIQQNWVNEVNGGYCASSH